MKLVAGACTGKLDGQKSMIAYTAGQAFEISAKSGFDIVVTAGICEYVCSYLG